MTKLRRSPSIRTTGQSTLSLLIGRAWGTAFAAAPIALLAGAVHAQDGQAPQIEQVLVTGARTLDEAPYMNGGVARRGGVGVLGAGDIMDTPFSTTNYTSQLLEDQQARTLADAVVNEASVRVQTSTSGFSDDFQIRGFSVGSGDVGVNGLYGLSSGNRMPVAMMERVEVLKGPGTLMYGISPSGSSGGNINIVTKRAGDKPLTRVTGTFESKSIFGAHVDVGRRFGDAGQWGVRFNGVYRKGDNTLDDSKTEFGLAALALDYRSSNLRWVVDAYAQREDTDGFRGQSSFRPNVTRIPDAPSGKRAMYPGVELAMRDSAISSRLEYDLAPNVMLYAAAGYHYNAYEQDFPAARGNDAIDMAGNLRITSAWYDAATRNKTGEVGARATVEGLGVKHLFTVSASRLEQESGSFYLPAPAGTAVESNIYHPVPLPVMTGVRQSPTTTSGTELSSIALTDTLSFFDNRVLVTGGVRKQKVVAKNIAPSGASTTSYDESATSPLLGIVVKPMANVSLYTNFTSGLTRGGTAPQTAANAGEVFAPYKSKQYEAGVKVEQDKLLSGISVFQIDRPNAVTDPVTTIYSMDGNQRNRGLELSVMGEAARNLRLMASATFYDAELQKTQGGLNEGNDANGVPKRALSAGLDWDLVQVPGLSFNARAIHTSDIPYNAANTLFLPSWTRFDIGARYRTSLMGRPVILRASVENVADKAYWLANGTFATAAASRTALVSAQFDF
ncbi:TonB-dependent siderophore receptor [Massilia sp. CFBP9012]|uniref:TonB-dependent receptor n=1 Tax=Massilia sp. CFBP9012 TaxID=3096531 RepID=UPI002A6A9AAB|nr:TonB-dependent siderophore receptor [Massilia sp. CFBP9012]MDY0976533.1 TonB-dependent siderophore receptor [Massilia sp. CFBP9012]